MRDAIDQSKAEIRTRMKAILAAMTEAQQHEASVSVCNRVVALDAFTHASTVMLYMPLTNEIDVTPIAVRCFRAGKTVCVPSVNWERRDMEPVEVTSLDDHVMDCDKHGVRVPKNCRPVPLGLIDAVIVPGLAFDPKGNRLGRSAGYYDRFLARLRNSVISIGVAFDQQIVDNLPTKPHDVAMDMVVTDRRVANVQTTKRPNV